MEIRVVLNRRTVMLEDAKLHRAVISLVYCHGHEEISKGSSMVQPLQTAFKPTVTASREMKLTKTLEKL